MTWRESYRKHSQLNYYFDMQSFVYYTLLLSIIVKTTFALRCVICGQSSNAPCTATHPSLVECGEHDSCIVFVNHMTGNHVEKGCSSDFWIPNIHLAQKTGECLIDYVTKQLFCICNTIECNRNDVPTLTIDECASNPCLSGAECIDRTLSYECTCPPTLSGDRCQFVNPCASSPCINGVCELINPLSYVCSCPPLFTGINCRESIACQTRNICGTGTCRKISENPGYECSCPGNLYGKNCERDIHGTCDISRCINGRCRVDRDNNRYCHCDYGYNGRYCDNIAPSCKEQHCRNGGLCRRNNYEEYRCECSVPFTGNYCEFNIDECQSSPCGRNGVCIDGFDEWTCECYKDYTGKQCESEVSSTTNSPEITTKKVEGTTTTIKSTTTSTPSTSTSISTTSTTTSTLTTPTTTSTSTTSTATRTVGTPCSSTPCQNDGQCLEILDNTQFLCLCTIEWRGDTCEMESVTCDNNPCEGDAPCLTTEFGDVICQCPDELIGDVYCRNHCASYPCKNDANCAVFDNEALCLCNNEGVVNISGQFCEIGNDDQCISSPCLNGGSCMDLIDGYQCFCSSQYTGVHCETLA
ncbi:hypothetical protein SNEBB_005199 [Seison nebaliae]|nr:hypothetical protein SNEBB_005199 [Seison nebaliae]